MGRHKKIKDISEQTDPRVVTSYRIKRERLVRFKEVCQKNRVKHCKLTEVLIEKFIRGEIIITKRDLKV